MNTPFGKNIKLYIEGASRDPSVSAVLCGLPEGFRPDTEDLARFMERRAPGRNSWSTSRREGDVPVFESGINDGVCTGEPVKIVISSSDAAHTDPVDYKRFPRPSHADYAAFMKYGESVDLRGGGHFSGRLTAPLCAAGRLCAQVLAAKGIEIYARIKSIGPVEDIEIPLDKPYIEELRKASLKDFPAVSDCACAGMKEYILRAKENGDSCGGVVECFVTGLPAGLGEHMFASCESAVSQAVFGIPGVKGIEFGAGFSSAAMYGSENNDAYSFDGKPVIKGNRAGGITGGMSTGAPLVFRVAFKPTPSIAIEQQTCDLQEAKTVNMSFCGRNDPCYVPRAVPAVEAAAALAIYDLWLSGSTYRNTAADFRRDIDCCDAEISDAYARRCTAVSELNKVKKDGPVWVPARENDVLRHVSDFSSDISRSGALKLYRHIFAESRQYQSDRKLLSFTGYKDKKIRLIGKPLGHSLSPLLHSLMADYSYKCTELSEAELSSFFEKKDFDGLNITIPYKKAVIKYMDTVSEGAAAAGAVNTVVKDREGRLHGYNTDIDGFIACFDRLSEKASLTRAVILGNGGAAAAIRTALDILGINDVITVSRKDAGTVRFCDLTEGMLDGALLVNCTPCGMFPDYEKFPFDLGLIKGCAAVADLVYNPLRTELYQTADKYGIPVLSGLYMLVCQAVRAAELFCGRNAETDLCEKLYDSLLHRTENTVLTGMPGCGKTSVGRCISEITGRRFFDTDEDFTERTGYTPASYIEKFGEKAFRQEETVSVRTASHLHGAVIATGGGAVLSEENRRLLCSCGKVFFIEREPGELDISTRPLSQGRNIMELYEERLPFYLDCADERISAGTIEQQAEEIIKKAGIL